MAWLARTFEAVVLDGDSVLVPAPRTSVAALRRRLESLCALGTDVVVLTGGPAEALDHRLGARTQGPGRLLLATADGAELHHVGPDGPSLLRAQPCADGALPPVLAELAARGVGPGLVLAVTAGPVTWKGHGVDRATLVSVGPAPALALANALHLGGGVATLLALLDEQARRRTRGHVPEIDHDPAWVLDVGPDDLRPPRCVESLLTLSDGVIGLRGSGEPPDPHEAPSLLAAGVYVGSGSAQHLLEGPWPLRPALARARPGRRRLDLRTGVLLQESFGTARDRRTLRFVAADRGGVVALRAEGAAARPTGGHALERPAGTPVSSGVDDGQTWARSGADVGGVVAAAEERVRRGQGYRTLERVVAYAADPERPPRLSRAKALLRQATGEGFDQLLRDHRATWSQRWDTTCVWIPDDPQAELAARFALFHLWSLDSSADELAVGARGLTGTGYAGHVFWDTDVFVLPALVTQSPRAARAVLEYRLRRLGSARSAARARGMAGARFPWESARDGNDVTPTSGRANGQVVQILTGQMEEHVVADVAWAACHYAAWSGDDAFLTGAGAPLVTETARYWASRVERDADGSAHLRHVIGPDEYHEDVDDNVFTNVLARWNLRRGAELTDDLAERSAWLELADALVDGYDPVSGTHEQFQGYAALEPLLVAAIGTAPVAADLAVGAQRIRGSQVVKQADVLMAHHLVPDELPAGSLSADLDLYLPRTAHGSSLSPAITAAVLARAGRPDEAVALLDLALRLDLDDLTSMTGAGLHLATLAGVWQALLLGFAGARVEGRCLLLDPCLPTRWGSLRLRFLCRGSRVELDLHHDRAVLTTDVPLWVATRTSPAVLVTGRLDLVNSEVGWEVTS